MKATIDFDDALYRRLKIEAARRGVTIRELVAQGVRYVLDAPASEGQLGLAHYRFGVTPGWSVGSDPGWAGSLLKYSANAGGRYDLPAVRESIARGRSPKRR